MIHDFSLNDQSIPYERTQTPQKIQNTRNMQNAIDEVDHYEFMFEKLTK